MCEKDYNLLRPFDLDAAKRGEPILWGGKWEPATFVGRSRSGKTNIIECEGMHAGLFDRVMYAPDEYLRMAPLCWVEWRPVYKRDVLYANDVKRIVSGVHIDRDGDTFIDFIDGFNVWISGPCGGFGTALTWTPPKVKREGWISIYKGGVDTNEYVSGGIHKTKHLADMLTSTDRIACIHIEWEE